MLINEINTQIKQIIRDIEVKEDINFTFRQTKAIIFRDLIYDIEKLYNNSDQAITTTIKKDIESLDKLYQTVKDITADCGVIT